MDADLRRYYRTSLDITDYALLADLTAWLPQEAASRRRGDTRELTADIYAVLRLLYPHGAWRGVLAKLRGDDGRVPIDQIPLFVNCAIEAMNPNS